MKPYLIIAIVIIVLILALLAYRAIIKRKLIKAGKDGEKIVSKILRRYAIPRSYKVLEDVYLPLYDSVTQIDHILIGFFGILVVETKNTTGEVYAQPNDKEWAVVDSKTGKKKYIYNPIMQNKTHVEAIRYLLTSNKMYKIDIDSLVVFTAHKKADKLYIKKGFPVILSKTLPKFLRKDRYETDKEIDVDQVFEVIKNAIVTDKDKIKLHLKETSKK